MIDGRLVNKKFPYFGEYHIWRVHGTEVLTLYIAVIDDLVMTGSSGDLDDLPAMVGSNADEGGITSSDDSDNLASVPAGGKAGKNEALLQLKGLTKDFKLYSAGRLVGRIEAVNGLDLEVTRGSIFGFLGPNGAGKTTTIQCACGMLSPDAGTVTVAGHDMTTDPSRAKACIGYLPEAVGLYPHLNALQTLAYYGSFYVIEKERLNRRATELLELFGLADRVTEKVGGYSLGMRKRLALAAALLHEPELLVLDEPTSGLDPQGVRALRGLLRDLNQQGLTIFFSSHVLSEVAQICDNVAILDRGRLVTQGSVAQLQQSMTGLKPRVEVKLRNLTPVLEQALRQLPEVEQLQARPLEHGLFGLELVLSNDITPVINQVMVQQGALVYRLAAREASLEELFMAYTEESSENEEGLTGELNKEKKAGDERIEEMNGKVSDGGRRASEEDPLPNQGVVEPPTDTEDEPRGDDDE